MKKIISLIEKGKLTSDHVMFFVVALAICLKFYPSIKSSSLNDKIEFVPVDYFDSYQHYQEHGQGRSSLPSQMYR